MYRPGDVIKYLDMCVVEGTNLQRGMNYKLKNGRSVILMSIRRGAPYADRIEDNGRTLIYEGHDTSRKEGIDPKSVDQPYKSSSGVLTQNGLFYQAAERHKGGEPAEEVHVYEKLRDGIWVYTGPFALVDAWIESTGVREVFKFKLHLKDLDSDTSTTLAEFRHSRMIPTSVKVEVWRRDAGKCVYCGSNTNLHFDHILPYSKGGTSLLADNIQLLCASCNLAKHDRIE